MNSNSLPVLMVLLTLIGCQGEVTPPPAPATQASGGDYANFQHSTIDDLTPQTVAKLQVAWSFPTGTPEQFEVSPVIYGGIMYSRLQPLL